MTESPHNNICMAVKRLKNIIARQQEVEDIEKVQIFSGEINLFLCWCRTEVKLKIQKSKLKPSGFL